LPFDAPRNGGMFPSGMTRCVKAPDPSRAQTIIRKLVAALEKSAKTSCTPGQPEWQLRYKTVRYGHDEVTFVECKAGTLPIAPAWAIHGDQLVIALYPQMVCFVLE